MMTVVSFSLQEKEVYMSTKEESLVYRLRKRAEIRRNINSRKSVQEGKADRISDLLEEAADKIDGLESIIENTDNLVDSLNRRLDGSYDN